MKPHYLLDTNICIYAISGKHPQITSRLNALDSSVIGISTIVLGELVFGISKSQRPNDALQRLAALLRVSVTLPLPESAAQHYGTIRAELERRGTPIGNNDLWIAAHARATNRVLVSNNQREFSRVSGLQLENWAEVES
jgi:tRNA(fMet)-specific endonuclease VapC